MPTCWRSWINFKTSYVFVYVKSPYDTARGPTLRHHEKGAALSSTCMHTNGAHYLEAALASVEMGGGGALAVLCGIARVLNKLRVIKLFRVGAVLDIMYNSYRASLAVLHVLLLFAAHKYIAQYCRSVSIRMYSGWENII